MGKGLILPEPLMADQCKSPAPPEETAQSTPLRMGSSAGDLWEGAWQVRNPVLVISITHSDPLSSSQLSVLPHTETAVPFSTARSQDGLSATVFSGRGGGVSESVPEDQDLILTSVTYRFDELGQVTWPVSKSISSHISVGKIISSHTPYPTAQACCELKRNEGVRALQWLSAAYI